MKVYTPPSDKSVTIRAVLLAGIADGVSRVENPLICDDTEAALRCMSALGVRIRRLRGAFIIEGRGLRGLRAPSSPLDAGESGAVSRMLAGILAGQNFPSVITGRGSLLKRPMGPLADVLAGAGADVRTSGGRLPLFIRPAVINGGRVAGIDSAQLKSALLLAGLYSRRPLVIAERERSRDHTERMLKFMGAGISVHGKRISLRPGPLAAGTLVVPGDISSAAFFISAALISGRPVRIGECGLNRLRLGFVRSLKRMGGAISIEPVSELPEPRGTMHVEPSRLRAGRFSAEEVPAMIDEIPLLAVTAAAAAGTTVISGVEPLRAKESDRIESTLALLASLGAEARCSGGTLRVTGAASFSALRPVDTFGDHRIAMAAAAASTVCPGLEIRDPGCVNKSYPGFWKDFKRVFGPAAAR